MRRQLVWIALGFFLPLAALLIGFVIWGNHIEHRIDHVVIERRAPRAAPKGGGALQSPSPAHQQPGPQPGGGEEGEEAKPEATPEAEPEQAPEESHLVGPSCVINALGIKVCIQAG